MPEHSSIAQSSSFDAVSYWRQRHRRHRQSLRSVGCRSFREAANQWFYRRVSEAYDQALKTLDTPPEVKVLDAGAGIGMYVPVFLQRGWQVTATDVSAEALEELRRRYPAVKTTVGDIISLPWPDQSFTLVHCFDVLYHVVDKNQWRQAIHELCRLSERYVAIHGPRLNHQAKSLRHLRQDSMADYREAFAAAGFVERQIAPTLFAFRWPWYYFRNVWPSAWVMIDRRLAARRKNDDQLSGAQVITIFERKQSSR